MTSSSHALPIALFLGLVLSACSSGDDSTPGAGGGATNPLVIHAEPNTWTWVPFEGAVCGDGSTTGMGIQLAEGSSDLVIYLQGGGVCYDQATCFGPMPSASHLDGFGEAEFAEFSNDNGVHGLFDRGDAANPFRDYNYVFVPYCTGDVHAGNKVTADIQFVGQSNLLAFLERIVPTFASPGRVVLTGTSAGGFGAMYNYHVVQAAFDPVPVVLIDDSGPFLPLSATPQLLALEVFFGLEGTIAPGCAKCLDAADPDGGLHQLIPHYGQSYPGHRISLISSLQDKTIASNFDLTGPELEGHLASLASQTAPANPDFRYYYLSGDTHVWLFGGDAGNTLSDVVSGGVGLDAFVSAQLQGDAGWSHVEP
jgi:hypothetical protein